MSQMGCSWCNHFGGWAGCDRRLAGLAANLIRVKVVWLLGIGLLHSNVLVALKRAYDIGEFVSWLV